MSQSSLLIQCTELLKTRGYTTVTDHPMFGDDLIFEATSTWYHSSIMQYPLPRFGGFAVMEENQGIIITLVDFFPSDKRNPSPRWEVTEDRKPFPISGLPELMKFLDWLSDG